MGTSFDVKNFIKNSIEEIRSKVKNEKVIAACSGGVDSTTSTYLTYKAIGKNLLAVFINDGFRREGEPEFVIGLLKKLGIRVRCVNASQEFFETLKGLTDAEEKRKAFRHKFYSLLGKVAKEEGSSYLVQGTIAADIVETVKGVKTQHNVLEQIGINPEDYGLKIIEPLKELYKPQVRKIARELGLPKEVFERMPFPGPGLSIRIIGEVTPEKIEIVRKATKIVEEETKGIKTFQNFAVLHEDRATGIKKARRVYGNIISVRVVESSDAITAKAAKVSYKILGKISKRITDEIPEVVRVCYDITDKPPATIEFE